MGEEIEESKEQLREESVGHNLKKCVNCDREIPKNTRFCRDCGTAQTRDAFLLLFAGCIITALTVFFALRLAAPYSLIINIAVPLITLVVFALILSLLLWR